MSKIIKRSARDLTYRFSGPEYLPADEDECILRDTQWERRHSYRQLKSHEIETLTQQNNSAADWSTIQVSERFNAKLVRGCRFAGFVRLGDMESLVLEFEGLRLPVGLYNSTLISCDIGTNVALHRVGYLANVLVGDDVVLHNIGELVTRPGAKFGNGFLWPGENESARPWLEVCNEGGGRRIAAFAGMLPADAWLWSKYRGEQALMARLLEITDQEGNRAGIQYGTVGHRVVIRDTGSVINAKIGSDTVIEGAGRLDNVTILGDAGEATRIGEGVVLSDGIVGYGCRVGPGVQAKRFVLGTRARLDNAARLTHSLLGDNSTVACCEMANSLVFPAHEQHHNNSFLIAAAVQGQSNIAAGATIGSNHNSRAADGEIVAERGFWPGLCTSFKHPSRFAAYTLVAKGDYASELNIPYPFSLVSNNEHLNCLQIIPAYWFRYNMYAVMRNGWKFRARDTRTHAAQHIEFSPLAPDTVEAMLGAMARLEDLAGRNRRIQEGTAGPEPAPEERRALGRQRLEEHGTGTVDLELIDTGVENSRRAVRLVKAGAGYASYREMAHYYAVQTVTEFMTERGIEDLGALGGFLQGERERQWVNLGGQLVAGADLARLKARIVAGELNEWALIHAEYDRLWGEYPLAKARHAFAVLLELSGKSAPELGGAQWADFLARAQATQAMIAEQTHATRAKDFEGAVRRMNYDSPEEMAAVAGTPGQDAFIARVREEAEAFGQRLDRIRKNNGLGD